VTDVFELPVTEAVNCCVAPVARDTEPGFTETDTAGEPVVTDIVALADFVVSATLTAVTEYVPATEGAV